MKTGKEIKSKNFKNFNVVFGSVNNKNPKTIYLNISAWSQPKESSDENYNRAIKILAKKVKQFLFCNSFDFKFNKEMTIVDLDLRESGIKKGKRSFMSCEINFYSNNEIPVNTEYIKQNLNNIAQQLIDSVFNDSNSFDFHKRKR